MELARVTFILGGARSGKSRYAEALVAGFGLDKLYLATGQAFDPEMRERIARHKAQRGDGWTTVEEPILLPARLSEIAGPGRVVLVDCLTLWLSNLMLGDLDIEKAVAQLEAVIPRLNGPVVFVSNEVGMGIVPENALARRFRDEQGRLNQRIAALSQRAVFMAAGLPLVLKDTTS